ncbi:hypothetical protein [Sphaerospermopsis aphanizomenoides]|uniref:hypothetical protein n=1 Tax=Sphaerospermopsis aphanizomenoides TaxID=459663 RepID=UPI001904A360|nr:hypothetical protein [Sphaerospermopsis aphanizomenoides]
MAQKASEFPISKVASTLLATTLTAASIVLSVNLLSQGSFPDGSYPITNQCTDADTQTISRTSSRSLYWYWGQMTILNPITFMITFKNKRFCLLLRIKRGNFRLLIISPSRDI